MPLPNMELDNYNINKIVNYEEIHDIPRFDVNSMSYSEFFENFVAQNRPGILTNVSHAWMCSQSWVKNDSLNVDYFRENYGKDKVPVSNCEKRLYNVQEKRTMILNDYMLYWEQYQKNRNEMECLYLKDWHFTKSFPRENAYTVPLYFSSDWLNEYYDNNPQLNDDYRFVYIGPKGSWTPFHSDVFTSFSWSANICGRKKWILLPPGAEEYFRDEMGNLKYNLQPSEISADKETTIFEVIQEKGEAIFVPSGWHHQVWNLEDTISINHNWVNACNVNYMWNALQKNLDEVKKEISDCQNMENWKEQCQLVLSASFGFNYHQFYSFLCDIVKIRIEKLRQKQSLIVYGNWLMGRNHMIFDLKKIFSILKSLIHDTDFENLDMNRNQHNPAHFLKELENFLSCEL